MLEYQNKLVKTIDKFTLSTLPHSILLLGDRGSGQQELIEYIANKFNMLQFDMTELINNDFINQIYSSQNLVLYCIDVNKITEKDQNILLKLYEEPTAYSYIILYCESDYNILETIKTRSYSMVMNKFTKDQLVNFISDGSNKELILNVCSTPGQIEEISHYDILSLYKLCDNIVINMDKSNYQNALSIANKINFKGDEYSKYPLYEFIKMLSYVLLEKSKCTKKYFYMYDKLLTMSKNIQFMLDKKRYFEHFITDIWVSGRER